MAQQSQASLRCDGWKMHQRHTTDNTELGERNSHFNGSGAPPLLAANKCPLSSPLRSSWIQRLRSSHTIGESQDGHAQDATDEDSRLVIHETSRKTGYGLGHENFSKQLNRNSHTRPLTVGPGTGLPVSSDRPPLQQFCFSQGTRRGFDTDDEPSHWPASEKSHVEPLFFVSPNLLPTVESLLPGYAKQGKNAQSLSARREGKNAQILSACREGKNAQNFSACREPSSVYSTWKGAREVFSNCDGATERTGLRSHWTNLSKPHPLPNRSRGLGSKNGDFSKYLKARNQCYFSTNENTRHSDLLRSTNPTGALCKDRCGPTSNTQTPQSPERCNMINSGLQLRGTCLQRQDTEGSPSNAQIRRSNEFPQENLSSVDLVKRNGFASSSKLECTIPWAYQTSDCSTIPGAHATCSGRRGIQDEFGRSLSAFEQVARSSQGSQHEQPVGSVSFTFNFGNKESKALPYSNSVQVNWPFSQAPGFHEEPLSSSSSSGSDGLPCNTSPLFCQKSSQFASASPDTIIQSSIKQPKGDLDSLPVNNYSKQVLSSKHNFKALHTLYSSSGENAQLTANKQTDIKEQREGVGVLSVGAPRSQIVKPNAGATPSKSNIHAEIRSGLVTNYLERAAARDPSAEWERAGCVDKPGSAYDITGAGGLKGTTQACVAVSREGGNCENKTVRPAAKAKMWIQRWCHVASARKPYGGVVEVSEGVGSNDRALAAHKREREECYGDTGAGAGAESVDGNSKESIAEELDMALAKRTRADERPWDRMLCSVLETERGMREVGSRSLHCSSSSSSSSSKVGGGGRESHFLRRFFAPSAAAMAIIGTTARQVYAAQPEKKGLLGAWPSPQNFASSAAGMANVPLSEAIKTSLTSKKGSSPLPPIDEPCRNPASNRNSQVGA